MNIDISIACHQEINQDFHGACVPEGPALASKGVALALADGISSSDVSHIASAAAVHALLQEEMSVALPARHRLTRRPKLTLKDLAAEDFILYRRPDGRGLYDVIIAACSEAGFSPHVSQEAPRIVSTLNLVAAGLGITIVPASLSRLPLEGVTYRPLTGRPALKVPLNLACRRDEHSAATLGFIDLVRQLA